MKIFVSLGVVLFEKSPVPKNPLSFFSSLILAVPGYFPWLFFVS